mmetsp:Transcript_109934/g.316474  ORF Transcript_109934/g.316474 Transcript_109934/m.316474 type:complete len:311 (+) Transcript_109934:1226-2158(+)
MLQGTAPMSNSSKGADLGGSFREEKVCDDLRLIDRLNGFAPLANEASRAKLWTQTCITWPTVRCSRAPGDAERMREPFPGAEHVLCQSERAFEAPLTSELSEGARRASWKRTPASLRAASGRSAAPSLEPSEMPREKVVGWASVEPGIGMSGGVARSGARGKSSPEVSLPVDLPRQPSCASLSEKNSCSGRRPAPVAPAPPPPWRPLAASGGKHGSIGVCAGPSGRTAVNAATSLCRRRRGCGSFGLEPAPRRGRSTGLPTKPLLCSSDAATPRCKDCTLRRSRSGVGAGLVRAPPEASTGSKRTELAAA